MPATRRGDGQLIELEGFGGREILLGGLSRAGGFHVLQFLEFPFFGGRDGQGRGLFCGWQLRRAGFGCSGEGLDGWLLLLLGEAGLPGGARHRDCNLFLFIETRKEEWKRIITQGKRYREYDAVKSKSHGERRIGGEEDEGETRHEEEARKGGCCVGPNGLERFPQFGSSPRGRMRFTS